MSRVERIETRRTKLTEGLVISRALPTRQQRMVGAWCFLDHIGPIRFEPGGRMQIGAHPHTCLQTFTWVIDGEILHRDSLGSEQVIRPLQVNLMTAGRGVAHTEESLSSGSTLHAAQLWIALPEAEKDCTPAFDHYPDLPGWEDGGCIFTLLAGSYGGRVAPTRLHSPLVGMDVSCSSRSDIELHLDPGFEYGMLILEGGVMIENEHFDREGFAYIAKGGTKATLELHAGSRILIIGGEPFDKPVLMWWNFVGFSHEEIAKAQHDWESGDPRFGFVKGSEGRRLEAPELSLS
ncbi:MAG: pirin family protein [Chlorobiaceae bacterium]|nr:pirin family protein [Chlorobiaceae bacterium]